MGVKQPDSEFMQELPCGSCMTLFQIDVRKGVPYQAYCRACEELSNFYIARRQEMSCEPV
jgi:hypothetical protein